MAKKVQVAILMGSDSDAPVMQDAFTVLKKFKVSYEAKILSAHRTPEQVKKFITTSEKNGVKVFIAGAGCAAHLAGVIASHTIRPVIGVPLDASPLGGLDSLLATVQMPAGVPVATVAIGKGGAYNAALLAVQCLAISSTPLASALRGFKEEMVSKVADKNKKLQALLKN